MTKLSAVSLLGSVVVIALTHWGISSRAIELSRLLFMFSLVVSSFGLAARIISDRHPDAL